MIGTGSLHSYIWPSISKHRGYRCNRTPLKFLIFPQILPPTSVFPKNDSQSLNRDQTAICQQQKLLSGTRNDHRKPLLYQCCHFSHVYNLDIILAPRRPVYLCATWQHTLTLFYKRASPDVCEIKGIGNKKGLQNSKKDSVKCTPNWYLVLRILKLTKSIQAGGFF